MSTRPQRNTARTGVSVQCPGVSSPADELTGSAKNNLPCNLPKSTGRSAKEHKVHDIMKAVAVLITPHGVTSTVKELTCMDDTIPHKTCTRCGARLPATPEYFHRHKLQAHGVRPDCKTCVNRIHREKATVYGVATARWRDANRETVRSYSRKCEARRRAEGRSTPSPPREVVREYERRHREKYPELHKVYRATRRARIRNAEGSFTAEDVKAQRDLQNGECYWKLEGCQGIQSAFHVDHYIPLIRGGSNGPENIVITCPRCNLKKGTKMPLELPSN